MDNRVPLSLIGLLVMYYESAGELIHVPHDTAVKVNQSAYFNCSTTLVAKQIFWYHGEKLVYTLAGDVGQYYKEGVTVEIDNATGACNLVFRSVQPGDAGVYKCWEDEGVGEKSSAQLIVLDDGPTCKSNVKLDNVIGQNSCNLKRDMVELSCSVTYHGNIPPHMEWKKTEGGIFMEGVAQSALPGKTHKSTLMLENDISLHNSAYVCQINGTAMNQYTCISEVIMLSYSVGGGEVVHVEDGTDLTCSANTTFNKCNYIWFHKDDSACPVSCNQHLQAHTGEYYCQAICYAGDKSCKFVAMNVTVIPKQDSVTERMYRIPAFVIMGSCLLGAIGLAVFLYLNPRKKPRNIDEALTYIHFSSELLLHVKEKERETYCKKKGKDPFAQTLISGEMMQALRQVHSMFPVKETPRTPNNKKSKTEQPEIAERRGNGNDSIGRTSHHGDKDGTKGELELQ